MLKFSFTKLTHNCKPNRSNHRHKFSTKNDHKTDYLGIVVFSGISCGTFVLGVWQWQRYQWKSELVESGNKNLLMLPTIISEEKITQSHLSDIIREKNGQLINIGEGTFDHTKELSLGPRSAPNSSAQGMSSNPQGYYVLTPFRRKDGTVVIVKRGWIPLKISTAKSWKRPTGTQVLSGLASNFEKRGTFSPKNDPASGKILWLEEEIFSQMVDSTSSGGGSIALIDDITLEERKKNSTEFEYPLRSGLESTVKPTIAPIVHLAYSVTWFSLAFAGAFMTFSKFRRPHVASSVINRKR